MRQDYYFVSNRDGEYGTDDVPLYVNCAGMIDTDEPFFTTRPRGRLDYTFYYLHRGRLSVTFANRPSLALDAGAIILIPPNVRTEYWHEEKEVIEMYWTHFTGNYVRTLLSDNGLSPDGCILSIPVSSLSAGTFQSFLDEMKNPSNPITRHRSAAAMVLTLTELTQLWGLNGRYRRIQRSFAYIQEHFTEPISKELLASMENLGVAQYYRLFKQNTGFTPTQYITKLRMMLACQLLSNISLSVNDVASSCGYDDPFYFSRVFRKEYGVSPAQYRTAQRT